MHVRQWTHQGTINFARRYVTSFAKNLYALRNWQQAYHQIDAELEAKRETTDWRRRRSRDVYVQAIDEDRVPPSGDGTDGVDDQRSRP